MRRFDKQYIAPDWGPSQARGNTGAAFCLDHVEIVFLFPEVLRQILARQTRRCASLARLFRRDDMGGNFSANAC